MPARQPVPAAEGVAAVREVLRQRTAGLAPPRVIERVAVRYLLEELARRAPGRSVEVRVPPFAAVQAVPGPRHTRGTPPAVVEMPAETWLNLATGLLTWDVACERGDIRASGLRTDLSPWLPLTQLPG